MIEALFLLFSFLQSGFRNRTELALENLEALALWL